MQATITNLEKSFFEQGIGAEFPEAWEAFEHFLTRYMESVGWDKLFRNDIWLKERVTFYDLPVEMQIGIIAIFLEDDADIIALRCEPGYIEELKEKMRDMFASAFKMRKYETREIPAD